MIGEGYPEERAFSDDSPMKVVGLLRNAGVPFTTQFRMGKYSKPKLYKVGSMHVLLTFSKKSADEKLVGTLGAVSLALCCHSKADADERKGFVGQIRAAIDIPPIQ